MKFYSGKMGVIFQLGVKKQKLTYAIITASSKDTCKLPGLASCFIIDEGFYTLVEHYAYKRDCVDENEPYVLNV